jgi:hypothetical protein
MGREMMTPEKTGRASPRPEEPENIREIERVSSISRDTVMNRGIRSRRKNDLFYSMTQTLLVEVLGPHNDSLKGNISLTLGRVMEERGGVKRKLQFVFDLRVDEIKCALLARITRNNPRILGLQLLRDVETNLGNESPSEATAVRYFVTIFRGEQFSNAGRLVAWGGSFVPDGRGKSRRNLDDFGFTRHSRFSESRGKRKIRRKDVGPGDLPNMFEVQRSRWREEP